MAVKSVKALKAGDVVGILGGGQLGRMLAQSAARLGLKTVVLDPAEDCPAAQVCNYHIIAPYDNVKALEEMAEYAHVVTYEFENVPVVATEVLKDKVRLAPNSRALEISQDRFLEKNFLNEIGLPTAPYETVNNADDLYQALKNMGRKGILKTRRFGYDGKGQIRFSGEDDLSAAEAIQALTNSNLPASGAQGLAILEGLVNFEREVSIIAARSHDGEVVAFDPAENIHKDGILSKSIVPAHASKTLTRKLMKAAQDILTALDYVGVIGIEFFITRNGRFMVNEFAPRVHNSGHWTEAACLVSQFEQHIRAIAGWSILPPHRHSNCEMDNLIGDDVKKLPDLLAQKNTCVTLYGKSEARAGRKMGHYTLLTGKAR